MTTRLTLKDELQYRKGVFGQHTIIGMPSKYFIASFALGLVTMVNIGVMTGGVLLLFLLLSLYQAHRNDPAAVDVFLYALRSKTLGFRAGESHSKHVLFVDSSGQLIHSPLVKEDHHAKHS